MTGLAEELAAVVGAYVAVWLVRRLRLERQVRAGVREMDRRFLGIGEIP